MDSYSDSYSYSYTYSYSDFILFPEQGLDTSGVRRDQTREEVEANEQTLGDSPPQHGDLELLFNDAEQSGSIHDGIDGKCPATSLFACDPAEEDENPLKEKYAQEEFPLSAIKPLLTVAAAEHESNTTAPKSPPRSITHQENRDTPLTPEQIDQLLILWGTPELIEHHHRSRLIRDLEREDRTADHTSKEEKEVYIYEWLDKLPICYTPSQSSCGNAQ
ncbi:hypothetical protein KCU95_g18303, partial [Aureobasidium melanogenum]